MSRRIWRIVGAGVLALTVLDGFYLAQLPQPSPTGGPVLSMLIDGLSGLETFLEKHEQWQMDTALYYTFSTIAQALAGAIAFLAAVVLFKLQGIDSELREHADKLANLVSDETMQSHHVHARWGEFIDVVPPHPATDPQNPYRRAHTMHLARMRIVWKARQDLVAALKASVPLTLIIMVAAVGVLALVPVLKCSLWLSIPALCIGAVAFGGCIATYWKVIAALWRP